VLDFESVRKPDALIESERAAAKQSKRRRWISSHYPNQRLVSWVVDYFRRHSQSAHVAPLFLQHEGHSRTIVGVERRNNATSLLLFDPSKKGIQVRKLIVEQRRLQMVKLSESTFDRAKYQIVTLEPLHELFVSSQRNPIEWERMKTIKSTAFVDDSMK
jgi:hypothetical protein